jgi:hypothetical protein
LRNSRVLASLCAFSGFLLVVTTRGWRGLDQIPSDPGYDYVGERVQTGLSVIEFRPYLYADQSTLASIASSLPLETRAMFLTFASHLIWASCALVVYLALRRLMLHTITSLAGGLLLVTTPWAAQSAIGNYGNVRWPILVAATVVVAAEATNERPRVVPLTLATVAAALSNPLHPLLLVPLLIGAGRLASTHRKTFAISALPLMFGLTANLLNVGAGGHSEKITSFWDGAGLFWVSGQVLPSAIALTGLALSVRTIRVWSTHRLFAATLFVVVLLIAGASYRLGGIADRYYVAPAALAAIGALVWLVDTRTRSANVAKVLTIALAVVLVVPITRWFFVFPYLRSAPSWSTQVDAAQDKCDRGETTSFELLTSNGESVTDPIPCDDL